MGNFYTPKLIYSVDRKLFEVDERIRVSADAFGLMIAIAYTALLSHQQRPSPEKQTLRGLRLIGLFNSNEWLVRLLKNFSVY